jgi:hydrogenase nickel incorporation protein HypB
MKIITVERKVLKKNDAVAAENRETFRRHGLFVINMLSSPGAGKTTLLERTIAHLDGTTRLGVIEGDVQTDRDAQRISRHNVPVVQIVTHGACHLEAKLVQDAMGSLELDGLEVVIIENVGNLVCPASFDLGEHKKVVIASTTEGDDKPVKYPKMFRVSDVCVLNKIDLLPHVDFDMAAFKRFAQEINPDLLFFETSARTGEGVDAWTDWLVSNTPERSR